MRHLIFLIVLLVLSSCKTRFVLLGSLGDLARKYLWSALNDNLGNLGEDFEIYGASRGSVDEGDKELQELLSRFDVKYSVQEVGELVKKMYSKVGGFDKDLLLDDAERFLKQFVKSLDKTSQGAMSKAFNFINILKMADQETAMKLLAPVTSFISGLMDNVPHSHDELITTIQKLIQMTSNQVNVGKDVISKHLETILGSQNKLKERARYLQLKKSEHFRDFCSEISDGVLIFYLSIPPSAYISTSQMIAEFCKKPGLVIRVAYEKPFGYDFNSAQELFTSLNELFESDNIFLIDHYLGKTITQQIPSLRHSMTEPIANIRVRLLESADCKGRAGYYDNSGVFRDMFQNHATELLLLTTVGDFTKSGGDAGDFTKSNMELGDSGDFTKSGGDSNSGDFTKSKIEFLKSLVVPSKHQVVLGQYDGYVGHVGKPSSTPTFAAVLLTSSLSRWRNIPFILTSGKAQGSDKKDITITFRSGKILRISYSPPGATLDGVSLLPDTLTIAENSYTTLLGNIIAGDRALLPVIDTVLESWRFWDGVIGSDHPVKVYPSGEDVEVEQRGKFLYSEVEKGEHGDRTVLFFNKALLVKDSEDVLYRRLAEDIIRVMSETLQSSDSFHIALSGGSTIVGLFKYLVYFSDQITWDQVHIWQVDERCDTGSRNSADLITLLLSDVPFTNLYLMAAAQGCLHPQQYQDELTNSNPGGKFDYVVLGLGSDGHTASLFPKSTILAESPDFQLVQVEGVVSPKRMTVNFDIINRAEWVAVLVTGDNKQEVINDIKNGGTYPISNVVNSHLTWYIENALL